MLRRTPCRWTMPLGTVPGSKNIEVFFKLENEINEV